VGGRWKHKTDDKRTKREQSIGFIEQHKKTFANLWGRSCDQNGYSDSQHQRTTPTEDAQDSHVDAGHAQFFLVASRSGTH
ncbi:hypothetical protein RRG08_058185, partial [Elysia crispata]